MRTLLQLLAILLLLTGHVPEIYGKTEARASLQEVMTLKSQMLLIHETFGVNFIYDSSLKLGPQKVSEKHGGRGSINQS